MLIKSMAMRVEGLYRKVVANLRLFLSHAVISKDGPNPSTVSGPVDVLPRGWRIIHS